MAQLGGQAYELMMLVHQKGLAVVGVFSHDIAETKVMQVTELAQKLSASIAMHNGKRIA